MTGSPDSDAAAMTPAQAPAQAPAPPPTTPLLRHLAELRGPDTAPRPLDARALAALAANPGCRRRALLDGAGVDKRRLAEALGAGGAFGQSQFAFARGHAFESRVKAGGAAGLAALVHERVGDPASPAPVPGEVRMPDLSAAGPAGRAARTRLALAEATAQGGWTVLDHPMLPLEVAGSPAYLEPDAVAVHPDGSWTIVEIKSFPVLDGAAEPAKVGAAARQAAVYALALERAAEHLGELLGEPGNLGELPEPQGAGPGTGRVRPDALLVCPKDFSNLPTAEAMDIRRQLAATRRQLARLTRVEEIAAALPPGTTFDPAGEPAELSAAVDSVEAAYVPDCLAVCELAFHCRAQAREAGSVAALGRAVRGELGGLRTVGSVLAAAHGRAAGAPGHGGTEAAGEDPAAVALRRAAQLRAAALSDREAAPCR